MRVSLFAVLFFLTSFSLGCNSSQTSKVPAVKLTPEEEGSLMVLEPNIAAVVVPFRKARAAQLKSQELLAHGNEEQSQIQNQIYSNNIAVLKNRLISLKSASVRNPPLTPAPSFQDVLSALRTFENLRFTTTAGPTSVAEQQMIFNAAQAVSDADSLLASTLSDRTRDFSGVKASNNLTAEVGFLKVDFAKGEVKVKHSWKTGPLKWSAGTGPGSGSIKTLIIQTPDEQRVFVVGGKPVRVYVQESIVETDGSTMVITAI